MKDTLKSFACMLVVFGALFLFLSLFWSEDKDMLRYSVIFFAVSVPLFLISSSMERKERMKSIENNLNEMCKIMKEKKSEN